MKRVPIAAFAALTTLLGSSAILYADGLRTAPIADAVTAKECSACHMLYPPGLLPARSWEVMMGNLKDHFGDNADLDEAVRRQITFYLVHNAADTSGTGRKLLRDLPRGAAPARISEMPWFLRKHERKGRIAPETLARRGAKSPGDCQACHRDAAKGVFEDD